jgi:RND superfamily putative drug exporter
MLAVLGPRVDALSVRPLFRRVFRSVFRRGRPSMATMYAGSPRSDTLGFWFRWAHAVMRRPVVFAVPVVAVLLALGAPFLHVTWGGIDARMEPTSAESHRVSDTLLRDFPGDPGGRQPERAGRHPGRIGGLQEYSQAAGSVSGATGARVVAARGDTARVDIAYRGEALDAQAKSVLKSVRALPHPAHVQSVLVGGSAAQVVDRLHSLGARLQWMALVVALATFVLLFLAFGSLVLSLKALVMNVLSLGASFGAVTLIFQDGHLSRWLGFTPTGTVEATQPVLVLAILFGLSMDYEVFLLSRVREQYDANGDNRQAVAVGIQRTGRIITSAALLLMVVIGLFSTSSITFIKLIGVAMLVALIIDATIVRWSSCPRRCGCSAGRTGGRPAVRQLYAR